MQIYGAINDVQGVFTGVGMAPPAGAKSFTVACELGANQLHDASNRCRLLVYADTGTGKKHVGTSPEWVGGPQQNSPPSFSWAFDPSRPPRMVWGETENGTQGDGSKIDITRVNGTFN